jgi:hypothetical protein
LVIYVKNNTAKNIVPSCSRWSCQMAYFQTKKKHNLGKIILWPFGNLLVIWYIFPRFGIFHHENSDYPGLCNV